MVRVMLHQGQTNLGQPPSLLTVLSNRRVWNTGFKASVLTPRVLVGVMIGRIEANIQETSMRYSRKTKSRKGCR